MFKVSKTDLGVVTRDVASCLVQLAAGTPE